MRHISGTVKGGMKRGRVLGFPTANIDIDDLHIEDGIYVAKIILGGNEYPALVFVGSALTFGEQDRKFEAYFLDFQGDLYGRNIEVELIKKLRDNKRFETAEALIAQMHEDERLAREFLGLFDKKQE